MTHKRWAAALALVSAVGCAKVDLPKIVADPATATVASAGAVPAGGKAAVPRTPEEQARAEHIQKVCQDLSHDGTKGAPVLHRSISEYSKLQDLLRAMSPVIQSDPALMVKAHEKAFRVLNDTVLKVLKENGKYGREYNEFKNAIDQYVHYDHLRDNDEDLKLVIQNILYADEGTPCSDYYLDFFYVIYLKTMDPLGKITFGSNSTQSAPDTLGESLLVPKEVASLKGAQIRTASSGASALWVTPLDLDTGPDLEAMLLALENRAKDRNGHGIVLDLRFAGGKSLGALLRIRQSALKGGWGHMPLLMITSYETRGVAAVLASEMASKPNVQVWGTESRTYGYGRKLEQRSLTLVQGSSEVCVVVGTQLLLPPGDTTGRDGYRMQLRDDNVLGDFSMDDLISRADQFAQTLINDAPIDAPDPNATPLATDAVNSQALVGVDPNAQPAPQSAAPNDPNAMNGDNGSQQAQQLPPGAPPQTDPSAAQGQAPQPQAPAPPPVAIVPPPAGS